MFISSPLIRGGGWGLRGMGEDPSRTFAGSPQAHGVAMQAAEESSRLGHAGRKRPQGLDAGRILTTF